MYITVFPNACSYQHKLHVVNLIGRCTKKSVQIDLEGQLR